MQKKKHVTEWDKEKLDSVYALIIWKDVLAGRKRSMNFLMLCCLLNCASLGHYIKNKLEGFWTQSCFSCVATFLHF